MNQVAAKNEIERLLESKIIFESLNSTLYLLIKKYLTGIYLNFKESNWNT
jgi:hypothetical protein